MNSSWTLVQWTIQDINPMHFPVFASPPFIRVIIKVQPRPPWPPPPQPRVLTSQHCVVMIVQICLQYAKLKQQMPLRWCPLNLPNKKSCLCPVTRCQRLGAMWRKPENYPEERWQLSIWHLPSSIFTYCRLGMWSVHDTSRQTDWLPVEGDQSFMHCIAIGHYVHFLSPWGRNFTLLFRVNMYLSLFLIFTYITQFNLPSS